MKPSYALMICVAATLSACSKQEGPSVVTPRRSDEELVQVVNAVPVAEGEVVIVPVDLLVDGDLLSVVIAAGSTSEAASTLAVTEYIDYIDREAVSIVDDSGSRIDVSLPRTLPEPDPIPIHISPGPIPSRKLVTTTKNRTWVLARTILKTDRELSAGSYRVQLLPRNIKLGLPDLDAWNIRFVEEQLLEARRDK